METPPNSRGHGGRDSPWYRTDTDNRNGVVGGGIELSKRGGRSQSAVPIERLSYSSSSRDEWARSRSPFFLQRAGQSCQSLASDLERPATALKRTPVFNDLRTAYSFVVSRKRVSQVEPSYSEENSIPLENLDPRSQSSQSSQSRSESPHDTDDKSPLLGNLPARPPPAVVAASRHRYNDQDIFSTYENRRQVASESEKPTTQTSTHGSKSPIKAGKSVLTHFKNALSFQSIRDDPTDEPSASRWHKGTSEYNTDAIKCESSGAESGTLSRQSIEENLPKEGSEIQPAMDGRASNYDDGWDSYFRDEEHVYNPFNTGEGLGIPEGSTVGNIYAHYMAYQESRELSDDGKNTGVCFGTRDEINHRASSHGFPSSPKNQHSKFYQNPRSPQTAGTGGGRGDEKLLPNFSLPKRTNHSQAQHAVSVPLKGANRGFVQGDARVPATKQGPGALNYFGSSGQAGHVGHHPGLNLVTKPSKGKEKTREYGGNGPEILVSPANVPGDRLPEDFDLQKRLPLEKEVSRALRRASGYSAYSIASNSTLPRELYEDLPSEAPTYRAIKSLLNKNAEITPPSDIESQNGERPQDKPQGQPFFDQQAIPSNWVSNRKRTTVRVPVNQVSLPDSPPNSPPEDFDAPFGRRHEFLEDDLNDWETVGESAASRPLDSEFLDGTVGRAGSSIANHSDDDNLSLGSFSSTDRITQHPGNIHYSGDYRQRDLKKSHIPVLVPVFREHKVNGYLSDSTRIRPPQNAFYRSPPPLTKAHENPFQSPPPAVMPSAKLRRPENVTLFPPLAHSHAHREPDISGLRLYQHKEQATMTRRSSQGLGWMDDFGDPGPMITTQREHVLRATAPEYASTWQDVIPYENNQMGAEESQIDGFVEMQTYGGKSDSRKKPDRKPFVNGGPGSFYHGLRASRSQDRPMVSSRQRIRSLKNKARRKVQKGLPTNALRKLSLLNEQRPSTPTAQITCNPTETPENDFVYRSPLAPPERNSWMALYTDSQMEQFRDAARSDDSQKRLFEAPRLTVFRRHSSNQTGLIRQKRKLSTIVLCLCSLFPPMLLLYALGFLDAIIRWWTRGQCWTFARGHKKVARILMYIWGLVVFLGLVAFLVCWFVVLRPRGSA